MGKNRNRVIAAALIGTMAVVTAGCGELNGSQVAATVDGEEISMGVLSFYTRFQQAQTSQMYMSMMGTDASGIWDQVEDEEEGTTYGDSLRDDALNQLEEMCLLKLHAEEYEVSISDEEQKKIEEAAAQFMEDNTEETEASLAVNQDDIERFLELATYYQKMRDPIQDDVDTEVSDEEAAQTTITYVQVQDSEETEESTESTDSESASSDTAESEDSEEESVDAQTQAQEVLDQVLASADADMDAIAQSVDENLNASTVSYSTNDEEDTTVPDALKEAVSGLQDGEVVSSLVENEGSYYVVRLDQAFDEEATENQKDTIISERKQDLYDETIQGWRDEADIQENKRNIRKLEVTGNDSYSFKAEETTEDTGSTEETAGDTGSTEEMTEDTGSTDAASEDAGSAEETSEGTESGE